MAHKMAILGVVIAGCVLGGADAIEQTPDTNSIENIWTRIQRKCLNQTPAAEFEPPATESQIQLLEDQLNLTLPDDYKQSLRLHNGMYSINGWELLSTDRVYDEWLGWSQMLDEGAFDDIPVKNLNSNDAVANAWWSKGWIPVLADGAGNFNCIDMRPGKNGIVGQVIDMDHEVGSRELLAKSYTDWLAIRASQLEDGWDSC